MEEESDPWADVVLSKRRFWRAIRWTPVVMIAAFCCSRIPLAAIGIVVIWGCWVAIRNADVEDHRCPRCGHELFRRGMYHNQFASRCLNCGQEIGAPVKRMVPHPSVS